MKTEKNIAAIATNLVTKNNMYLASTPSHVPIAVFTHFEDAEGYLCSKENVSLRYSIVEQLNINSTIWRVYRAAYPENPELTLGYITEGVQIDPDYVVG